MCKKIKVRLIKETTRRRENVPPIVITMGMVGMTDLDQGGERRARGDGGEEVEGAGEEAITGDR